MIATNISKHYYNILEEVTPIISASCNREFTQHAQNTVQWAGVLMSGVEFPTVSSLSPSDGAVLVASFVHEIERGMPNHLHPHDFQSYSLYKQASHIRSSEIMAEIMSQIGTPDEISQEIVSIIKNAANINHDCDEKTLIVREADALSFFSLSLPFFFVQRLSDKVLQDVCAWEFRKLSSRARKHLARLKFMDLRLKYYVNAMFSEILV
jgi:hypothetical protein